MFSVKTGKITHAYNDQMLYLFDQNNYRKTWHLKLKLFQAPLSKSIILKTNQYSFCCLQARSSKPEIIEYLKNHKSHIDLENLDTALKRMCSHNKPPCVDTTAAYFCFSAILGLIYYLQKCAASGIDNTVKVRKFMNLFSIYCCWCTNTVKRKTGWCVIHWIKAEQNKTYGGNMWQLPS